MENEQTPEPRSSVGSLLRATRLRAGINLGQISAGLRIRQAYIAAIEDSNYQALPGAAYAAGFVRAYAEYLSLDSEEVVRRFRAESAGAHASSQLRFPSPLSDRGIPGAALMFVGIVVATVAYGGWYLTTSENNVVAELVGPLPDRLAALLRSEPDVAGVEGDSQQSTSESAGQGTAAADGMSPAVAAASDPAADEAATAQAAPADTASAPEAALASETPQDTPANSATPAADMTTATTAASITPTPAPAGPPSASVSSSRSISAATNTATGTNVARPVEPAPSRIAAATTTPPSPVVIPAPAPATPAPVASASAAPPPSAAAAAMPAQAAVTAVQVPDVRAVRAAPESTPAVRAVTANSETTATTGTAAVVRADAQTTLPTATQVAAPADTAPQPQPAGPGASTVTQRSAAETTQGGTAAAQPAASAPQDGRTAAEPAVAALPAAPPNVSPAGATTGSRITVRAKMPSWIQVRDEARNELLVTRMMREGDTYPVPNQPGLTLMTGNAGALEILVDGAAVPAVGPLGAVRRSVALDAKRLLDGTAVSE